MKREKGMGLCLLPNDLLYEIFSRLPLPDLLRLRASCRDLRSFFLLAGKLPGAGGSWLFLFKKHPAHNAELRGFNDRAGRWFRFPLAHIFSATDNDLYLLAAAGDFFLFAHKDRRELVAVDLRRGAARRLPTSPLGRRSHSSWWPPGLKLLPSDSGQFRFVFNQLTPAGLTLFEYSSETDEWRNWVAAWGAPAAATAALPPCAAWLSTGYYGTQSILVASSASAAAQPVIIRPRFPYGAGGGMQVFGDGHLAVVRSTVAAVEEMQIKSELKVAEIELWGLSSDGGRWEMIGRAPQELMQKIGGRTFYAITGRLEVDGHMARLALMARSGIKRRTLDMMWVTFDKESATWGTIPVPDCGAKGIFGTGMAVTSSLGLWPE